VDELFSKASSEHWDWIVSYYLDEPITIIGEVYDKNNLEKTHQANDEIGIAKKRFGKILYKITEKVMYHMI